MARPLFSTQSDVSLTYSGRKIVGATLTVSVLALIARAAEPHLFLWLNGLTHTLPDSLWVGLSLLGNGWFLAALLLPLVVRFPQVFFAALIATPLTAIASRSLKALFSLPRPPSVLDASTFHLIGEIHLNGSMPSGHSITAFAIAIAITQVAASPLSRHAGKCLLLAGLIALSRIGMGVHWPEDVLVGAAIGGLCGLLSAHLASRHFPSNWLSLPETRFGESGLHTKRVALLWGLIGLVIAAGLFWLDEDRGMLPEFRYAFACLALLTSLNLLRRIFKR